jgi:predicted nucleotidyltransferase
MEAEALIGAVAAWAIKRDDIRAMALMGSWARGRARRASDLDLLLPSERPADYRNRRRWLREIDLPAAGFRPRPSAGASATASSGRCTCICGPSRTSS